MSAEQNKPEIWMPTGWDRFKSFAGWTVLIILLSAMTVYAVILLNSATNGGVEKFFENFPIQITIETNVDNN